ncbi:MAG: NeuD/PglB/VioB family sugar acetyltransferase [Chloroflexi bacterium]|nr:NeuD/PglB/VioB family sugar acetyltransferase [Chloroflexota bacterium]
MKKIVILGTGGNCIDILDTLLDINDAEGRMVYQCTGFLDDNPAKWDQNFHGVGVLGSLSKIKELEDCSFVFGIGSVSNFWRRKEILIQTGVEEERFETIIHPTASVSRFAKIGIGTVVFQNVTITSNAIVGRHVCILPNSIISHDDVIGDFSCIAGGVCISGNVQVGEGCYLGTNAAVKDGVLIGNSSLIGMGSVVLDDVPGNSVVVGNPARFLRSVQPGMSVEDL